MGLRITRDIHPQYAQHFRQRMFERYGLIVTTHEALNMAESLKAKRLGPDRRFVRHHDNPAVRHQEVWWVQFGGKWCMVILDPRETKMVTCLNWTAQDLPWIP